MQCIGTLLDDHHADNVAKLQYALDLITLWADEWQPTPIVHWQNPG